MVPLRFAQIREAIQQSDWHAVDRLYSGNPDQSFEDDLRRFAGGAVSAIDAAQNASFGPVIERAVHNEEAIDFASGKMLQMPEYKLKKTDFDRFSEGFATLATWMERQGMDAWFDGSSLTAFGMGVNTLTKCRLGQVEAVGVS